MWHCSFRLLTLSPVILPCVNSKGHLLQDLESHVRSWSLYLKVNPWAHKYIVCSNKSRILSFSRANRIYIWFICIKVVNIFRENRFDPIYEFDWCKENIWFICMSGQWFHFYGSRSWMSAFYFSLSSYHEYGNGRIHRNANHRKVNRTS